MKFDYDFNISDHAVEKYRLITGNTKGDQTCRNKIAGILMRSQEVYIKPDKRLKQLLSHNCKRARYFQYIGWSAKSKYLVVTDFYKENVITIHNGEADRWQQKPSLLDKPLNLATIDK